MIEMNICVECEHCNMEGWFSGGDCLSGDEVLNCSVKNPDGNCQDFEAKK